MAYIPTLKKKYQEEIIPSLKKEFDYSSVMQVPKLEKIVLNQLETTSFTGFYGR